MILSMGFGLFGKVVLALAIYCSFWMQTAVTKRLDNHDCVDVIYMDFAKAFDKVLIPVISDYLVK